MNFQNAILHLDLDAFFAEAEILQNTSLRGKPLIIGGTSERGVVSSCSYEARAFGVRSAMPMRLARQLCPDAIILRGDHERYEKLSATVRQVIADDAPVFEQASIDEFYLDLTGMDKYFGCWQWSGELRERITRETGLPISLGLSKNKTVSKVGTGEAKPNGMKLIEPGLETQFLDPLGVGKLPGVGRETERKLQFMGVKQIRTLREIPPKLLEREFGKPGFALWKKANGEDDSPVVPYREQDSMSKERTFQTDTIDTRLLVEEIRKMTLRLAFELREKNKLTACITVKIRYSDFNTFTKQAMIAHTASDSQLLAHTTAMFERLFERRQLVRLVGVRFSHFVSGAPQLNLFDNLPRETDLMAAMDRIRKRFGGGAIGLAG
jgi:DNA polymerase IV